MYRRLRLAAAGAALAAAFLASATPAPAFWTSDVNNWSLDTTWRFYNGGTQYHISPDGDNTVDFRWVDADMTKVTVISGNSCIDYSMYGKETYQGGDTSFHQLWTGFQGQCFLLRGRTETGSTTPHDGRLRR